MTSQSFSGSDRIVLTGLSGTGYHGVFDHERRDGQLFKADLVLHTDIRAAAGSDDLADTVDYGAVATTVHAILTGDPVDLIETLADRVASAVLTFPAVSAVEVRIHKPSAPITVPFENVCIEITRQREGSDDERSA